MGENDNKYGEYFYGKVPASSKKDNDSIFTKLPENFGQETSNSDKGSLGSIKFISEGKSPERNFRKFEWPTTANNDFISQGASFPGAVNESVDLSTFSSSNNRPNNTLLTDQQLVDNMANSIGNKKRTKYTKEEKNASDVFRGLSDKVIRPAVCILVACTFFVGYLTAKGVSKFSDERQIYNYMQQYQNVYDDNIIHLPGASLDANGDPYYDYDVMGMGKSIANAEDPEAALYAVYSKTDYHKYTVTHDAFRYAKEANSEIFGESDTFKDYVASLGCLDKEGKIDYDRYEEVTEARLLAKQVLAENTSSKDSVK